MLSEKTPRIVIKTLNRELILKLLFLTLSLSLRAPPNCCVLFGRVNVNVTGLPIAFSIYKDMR